jgi:hypothetical protein
MIELKDGNTFVSAYTAGDSLIGWISDPITGLDYTVRDDVSPDATSIVLQITGIPGSGTATTDRIVIIIPDAAVTSNGTAITIPTTDATRYNIVNP